MNARPPKLRIQSLSKSYGSVIALQKTDISLAEGEFLTLLGPSGSGKSTLLMLVAGIIQPTSGEIWIGGKLATYLPSHKRDIGVVFQNYALFPHLTIYENIAFPLRMRRVKEGEIRQRVAQALEVVKLGHVAQRSPRELSGGQQQRIALARCTVYEPSIILMDEPLGALDRKLRDSMQLEIKHLHKQLGITMLYVTHDQDEAMTMSDRICLMNDGAIEQIGTPEELYFRPRSQFVADFVGDSNLVNVTIVGEVSKGCFTVAGPGASRFRVSGEGAPAPGNRTTMLVRPESMRLLKSAQAGTNVLDGILREVVFVGAFCRYSVELADGTVIWAKELTHRPELAALEGKKVRIGWPEASACLLPTKSTVPKHEG